MSATEIVAQGDPTSGLPLRRLPRTDFPTYIGPATHLADENARLSALTWEHFDARMMGATIGAELTGIDLTGQLPQAATAEIAAALAAYKVVFLRDQHLTPAQHVDFARNFGELEVHPFFPSNTDQPELVRLAKDSVTAGYENQWHHDVTWRECPSRATVLRAIQVPDVGGDTLFADMYAAYEVLSPETKVEVDALEVVHDFVASFGRNVPPDRMAEMRDLYPEVIHPAVCTHDVTGRRHLYVNRTFVDRFVGQTREESLDRLDRLCRLSDTPEYQCRFHWEPDSVAFWDNRAVQHLACSDYWPQTRVMERASIMGDRPRR
ncbi:MAG: TauD/TfdA family dioxygenase [Actinobacteria bacterium]|nr:TauD/TfdA family dioxygenase [Actinomycetota bacterium]